MAVDHKHTFIDEDEFILLDVGGKPLLPANLWRLGASHLTENTIPLLNSQRLTVLSETRIGNGFDVYEIDTEADGACGLHAVFGFPDHRGVVRREVAREKYIQFYILLLRYKKVPTGLCSKP